MFEKKRYKLTNLKKILFQQKICYLAILLSHLNVYFNCFPKYGSTYLCLKYSSPSSIVLPKFHHL